MKNLLMIAVALSLLVIVGETSAKAQIVDTIEANIPFDFTAGKINLPAGKYSIKSLNPIPDGVIEIRSNDGHTERLILTESAQTLRYPRQTELIFERIGDRYFLSKIFEKGDNYGAEVKKTRLEIKLEKQSAMAQRQAVVIPAHCVTGS